MTFTDHHQADRRKAIVRLLASGGVRKQQDLVRLLHKEGFTIAGANKYIRENGIDPANIDSATGKAGEAPAKAPASSNSETRRALAEMRRDLESIHKLLDD